MPQPAASALTRAGYRGRLAPSPTGYLHLGHARTFWTAYERAVAHSGTLILRNEDLDRARCRAEFVRAMLEDLAWLGITWQEGPDVGGHLGPYNQSQRHSLYEAAFQKLKSGGFLYPCSCSRQDVLRALGAPHAAEDEPIYPGMCRPKETAEAARLILTAERAGPGKLINWRFRISDGEPVSFVDGRCGPQTFIGGKDFGDFVVWRHDQIPSYQLAVVVDDAAMGVTEVVRGTDLLRSTARQLLLYRALGLPSPEFYHCPLVTDRQGLRLAKRHESLSLRQLRAAGRSPEVVRTLWEDNRVRNSEN